jgi:phage gp36-like protein
MYSDNKLIRDVANIAAQIMSGKQPVTEKLHPNQQKLDVHEPEKDELTSDDFKKLRAGKKPDMKKEEAEQVDEAKKESKEDFDARQKRLVAAGNETAKDPERLKKLSKIPGYSAAMSLAKKSTNEEVKDEYARKVDKYLKKKYNKEEVEELVEYTPGPDGKTMIKGRSYGASKPESDYVKGPSDAELKKIEAEKKKKQKKFSEMVNLYQEKGLKSLSEMLVKEEPDNEQFTKELEDAKAKSEGKKKNTEIAKGAVQAVKQEEFDINAINGVQMSTIEERMMTEPEKEKKEDIVKGMKKSMAGFKDRYGDRAKEVMYATATKNAMKD